MNKKLLWITRTATYLALLVIVQFSTKGFSPFVTGSLVNFLLIITGLTVGLTSGLSLAIISPILAFILGIQVFPTPLMIPVIFTSNMILVFITWYSTKYSHRNEVKQKKLIQISGSVLGALLKFVFLWVFTSLVLGPIFNLPPVIIFFFSWPQLVTALIGGALALAIYPVLTKILKSEV